MKKLFFAGIFLVLIVAGPILAQQPQAYPQLDISGFKKWEYKKVEVDPTRNYFSGLTGLGGFYPTFSGSPWQERLQLKILGQLSDNLSVTYDLEQQPETPDKFDVKVKYNNSELAFGDLNANFSGNEFVSASKYINGVMLSAKESWYDVIAVPSSKLKSQTQNLTSQKGGNTRGPYNLGHGGIIEGSEQIQLNGNYLSRNTDYTIDYFEGKITFNRILNQSDEFKYSYEYTNIMDLFFPTLSKRDFFGFQSRFVIDPEKFGRPTPKEEQVISSARDVFPSAGTAEPEVQEEESSGRYRLRFAPVMNFSEVLTFMGTQLKKNEDYLIRYDTGEIKLLTKFLPTPEDNLIVEYRYPVTSTEAENIAGIGSRGPYRFKHTGIMAESVKIEVDGKPFVKDLDYTINYNTGEILFGIVIGPTSQIKAAYNYNVTALPEVAASKFPKELKIGTTYLKESAKKGAGASTSTVIEGYVGQNLIDNNFVLSLKNRPIMPTTEASFSVRLKQGGVSRELTREVDYTIPYTTIDPVTGYVVVVPSVPLGYITDRTDPTDGFGTGTLYFYDHSISASDEVTVTYSYKKSIVGRFSGVGDGSQGPYYLRNIKEMVPGSETVQVWEQGSSVITTYTRNTSFEANAGDTGYSINYNTNNPSITFNKALTPTQNFQIIYQYVPPSGATSNQDISQSAFGFDGSFKIGDVFKIDSSFARSDTDQVFQLVPTSESFFGNGTKVIRLNPPADIAENSEKVYVNLQLLNKDSDYFINYTGNIKQINFYYITPASQDAIRVDYSYQSQGGISPIAEVKTKSDTAFRLGAETKLFGDMLTLNGATKKIGFDFAPLGGTAIGVGSEYEEYNASIKPSYQSFYTNYSYKYNKNPIGATRNSFMYSYNNSISTGINPGGLAKLDFGYQKLFSIDDPSNSTHSNDSLQESYSASLVPSEWKRSFLTFNQKYDFRKTSSVSDYVDLVNKTTSNVDYYHLAGDLKLTDRFSFSYDQQNNEPTATDSFEAQTAHSKSVDNSYGFTADLTAGFLQKWIGRISVQNHDEFKYLPTPESSSSTKNETYHTEVTPFSMLTGSLDHNRQERTSYVTGGENPKTIRTSGNARFSPLSWLSTGINASKSESIPETGAAFKTTSRTKAGDVDLSPPLPIKFAQVKAHFAASNAYQLSPLGSETVKTDTDSSSQSYNLTLNPIPILPLSFGYTQEDYKNYNNSITSPVSTETRNLTTQVGLSFTPLPVFTLSGDYNQKVTQDLLKGTSPTKTVLSAKASYRVSSWGTLALDWQNEKNLGEVQAGAVASLNIEKDTLNRSFNITIPIDNPALSSFVLIASWKSVNYKNLAKPDKSDDFYAQLISLEGTMNF